MQPKSSPSGQHQASTGSGLIATTVAGAWAHLESAEFYAEAHRVLRKNGVFVANMWSSVSRYRGGLRRLRAVFGVDNIVLLPAIATENVTVIASKSPLPALDARAIQARARASGRPGITLERWLKALAPVATAL